MNARFAPVLVVLFLASHANAGWIAGVTLTDLGAGVVPNAINNVGQVVGQDALGQAFLWQGGTATPLGTLGGTQSSANDINDSGEIVGWSDVPWGSNVVQHAFKWTSGGNMVDINAGFLNPFSFSAQAVNANGAIVGWGVRSGGAFVIGWQADGTELSLFCGWKGSRH